MGRNGRLPQERNQYPDREDAPIDQGRHGTDAVAFLEHLVDDVELLALSFSFRRAVAVGM